MILEHHFEVDAEPARVWTMLLDLERVAGCLPGATVEAAGDGSFRGEMKLKLGPVRARYEGAARLLEVDDDERRAVIDVSGREAKGQGTAHATVTSRVTELAGSTRVDVATDLAITGAAAQFGRGIVTDVADTLVGQFADSLGTMLTAPAAAAAVSPPPQAELDLGAAAWQPVLRAAGPPLAAFLVGLSLGLLLRRPRRAWAPPAAS